jgi:phosphatidylserine/phosphatidylglycerophosphate/cardiolipin synthase-like enzyme
VKVIIQPDAGSAPVVQVIRRARRAVAICIFRLDRPEIEEALGAAVARGVKVSALIAHTNRGGENRLRKLEQRLLAAGVTVARTSEELLRYHGKFLVVDDVLHVFAFNLTKVDLTRSRSFGISTRDKRTVEEALKLFKADMTRRPYRPSRSNLVVSPETSREMLAAFLKGARKELAIYDAKIQDPAMIRIIKERAAKGVRVRVLGNLKGPDGAVIVRPVRSIRLHVRAIIRDGTRAFVGSQSLRKTELGNRREVGLLISNPVVTRKLMQVFEADWDANAKDKDKDKDKRKEEKDQEPTAA